VITLTRVTDSSFYNYGRQDLQHKLIVLEDLDGLKEDALLAFRANASKLDCEQIEQIILVH
jgi:hypothetical protein